MRVAIDGPAGSGKSTVAHAIADRCSMTFLDTGAMYRAVTCECARLGIDPADADAVAEVARTCTIDFGAVEGGQTVSINGRDVTREIRTPQTDANVSAVSAIPAVREAMVGLQRELGRTGDVVAEGRDIGTVVFPDAEVKVFLTASPEARAHRRAVQRTGADAARDAGAKADAQAEADVLADIRRRDLADSTRAESPLRPADDAHHIDSSDLTLEQVIDMVIALDPRLAERAAKAPSATDVPKGSVPSGDGTAAPARAEGDSAQSPASSKRPSGAGKAPASERMRAFAGNSPEDYYDHAIADWPLPSRLFLGMVIVIVGALSKVLMPWHIVEGERLWGDRSGRMLIMNHCSAPDPAFVMVTAYLRGIRVRPIYKSEFNSNPLFTWFFSRVGGIPVKRGTADIRAVRRAADAMRRGECVLVFPEGTRVRDDEPHPIHAGFALMAQMAKAGVQPLAIVGARNIKPVGARLPRPFCPIWVKVGQKVTFEELGDLKRKEQVVRMEEVAMDKVWEMRAELRAEHPGRL